MPELLSRAEWRTILRERRRSIPAQTSAAAAEQAAELLKSSDFWAADSLALYLPNDGELSPDAIARAARRARKRLFLPVIAGQTPNAQAASAMTFREWRSGDELRANRYGIGEPPPGNPAGTPELVVVPTVGWSSSGYRLGMGGGYYDRALAMLPPATRLLGLAYECQREDSLDALREAWDVPVQAMLTESAVHLTD